MVENGGQGEEGTRLALPASRLALVTCIVRPQLVACAGTIEILDSLYRKSSGGAMIFISDTG